MKKTNLSNYLATFFWDFKRRDNVEYNIKILTYLYYLRHKETSTKLKSLLNKPIIILIISIIECILYDFIRRVKEHTYEKIPNLDMTVIDGLKYKISGGKILKKKLKQLTDIIDQLKKFNLLDLEVGTVDVYDQLEILRQMRNRVHIQHIPKDQPKDEKYTFKDTDIKKAEKVFETVIKAMVLNYPRPGREELPLNKIKWPWDL